MILRRPPWLRIHLDSCPTIFSIRMMHARRLYMYIHTFFKDVVDTVNNNMKSSFFNSVCFCQFQMIMRFRQANVSNRFTQSECASAGSVSQMISVSRSTIVFPGNSCLSNVMSSSLFILSLHPLITPKGLSLATKLPIFAAWLTLTTSSTSLYTPGASSPTPFTLRATSCMFFFARSALTVSP